MNRGSSEGIVTDYRVRMTVIRFPAGTEINLCPEDGGSKLFQKSVNTRLYIVTSQGTVLYIVKLLRDFPLSADCIIHSIVMFGASRSPEFISRQQGQRPEHFTNPRPVTLDNSHCNKWPILGWGALLESTEQHFWRVRNEKICKNGSLSLEMSVHV